tara:strand:- start:3416 stop:4771 length:1356 start_codon:yes stop_codon:yes gene_type:complete
MANQLPSLDSTQVAIIGLGYVGLPLAVEIAECRTCLLTKKILNRKVVGFDLNLERIQNLKEGYDYTNELTREKLKSKLPLKFTADEKCLNHSDIFIITVPTPVDEAKRPDFKYLKFASEIVGKAINKRNNKNKIPIVVYESTVYPGATEEVCVPILEKFSKLKLNSTENNDCFLCGYSPERVNPGDKEHTLSKIIKVTSGSNALVAEWINNFYGSFIKAGTHKASSIKVAEAAKVIENTQRDLNIALINEFSIIFNKAGIDTLDVLQAAETKWNFLKFKPGLVGGHCIGVDPYYLTYKAQMLGYNPELVLAGRRINDNMAIHFGEMLILELVKNGQIKNAKILILGITFKENCPDMRNSKVIDLINILKKYNLNITVLDPYCDLNFNRSDISVTYKSQIQFDEKFHAIVGAVNHDYFKNLSLNDFISLGHKECVFMDLKGMLPRSLKPIRP